jgi:transposase
MSQYTAEMVVFCDESGLDKRDGARRTGWAPRGKEAVVESAFTRGVRWHILPALTVSGVLDLLVYRGHTNTEGFLHWLENGVLPKMNQFPGPNSILVMDNASWHRDLRVPALCTRFKILLIYLPPYSPDYNPIEAYFGDCKAFIRRSYHYNGGDAQNDAEFKEFLISSAMERSRCTEAIRGHYRQARVEFRDDEEAVNYQELYSS